MGKWTREEVADLLAEYRSQTHIRPSLAHIEADLADLTSLDPEVGTALRALHEADTAIIALAVKRGQQ